MSSKPNTLDFFEALTSYLKDPTNPSQHLVVKTRKVIETELLHFMWCTLVALPKSSDFIVAKSLSTDTFRCFPTTPEGFKAITSALSIAKRIRAVGDSSLYIDPIAKHMVWVHSDSELPSTGSKLKTVTDLTLEYSAETAPDNLDKYLAFEHIGQEIDIFKTPFNKLDRHIKNLGYPHPQYLAGLIEDLFWNARPSKPDRFDEYVTSVHVAKLAEVLVPLLPESYFVTARDSEIQAKVFAELDKHPTLKAELVRMWS